MISRLRCTGVGVVVALVGSFAVLGAGSTARAATEPMFVALARPARALDTRSPNGATTDGAQQLGGKVVPAEPVALRLGGRFAIPTDARAAVVNLTVDAPEAAGWATVWPCGSPRPATSNINFIRDQTVANGVVVGLGTDASICLYSDARADLIVDVSGYFPHSSGFTPADPPLRMVDSRPGGSTEDHDLVGFGPFEAKVIRRLQITGRVAALRSAPAVTFNLTATGSTAAGWATVWPCDAPRPSTSSINFSATQTVANSLTVRLAPDGSVCLYSSVKADFLLDVMGVFPDNGFDGLGAPVRLLDTRPSGVTDDHRFEGPPLADRAHVIELPVAGRLSIPSGAATAVLNVTVTGTTASGWATLWPCDTARPNTSSINFGQGVSIANSVVTRIGKAGTVCIYADTATDVIVDVTGVFQATALTTSEPPTVPVPPATSTPAPATTPLPASYTATGVLDGATFTVTGPAGTQTVHLIGVSAAGPIECWGHEAAAALSDLVVGKTVTLTKDVSEADPDGRLLRYVAVDSVGDVGLSLVKGGHVAAVAVAPDTARAATYTDAVVAAEAAGLGRWTACASSTAG